MARTVKVIGEVTDANGGKFAVIVDDEEKYLRLRVDTFTGQHFYNFTDDSARLLSNYLNEGRGTKFPPGSRAVNKIPKIEEEN